MIILDTSVWIEFFKKNPVIFPKVKILLEDEKILGADFIFGELLQGARNKKERDIISAYWQNIPKVDSFNIWIQAGIYSSENKLISKGVGLIDCAIIISSRKHNANIWSLDKKLNELIKKEEKFA